MYELNNVLNNFKVYFLVEARKPEDLFHNLSRTGFQVFKFNLESIQQCFQKDYNSAQIYPYPPPSPLDFGQESTRQPPFKHSTR